MGGGIGGGLGWRYALEPYPEALLNNHTPTAELSLSCERVVTKEPRRACRFPPRGLLVGCIFSSLYSMTLLIREGAVGIPSVVRAREGTEHNGGR